MDFESAYQRYKDGVASAEERLLVVETYSGEINRFLS